MRLDFVATIKTDSGENKKVLIEIQKARDTTDVMRFRSYLAEHYKRKDSVIFDGNAKDVPLPIITLYLLGFNLPETDSVVIHVNRRYNDMISNRELKISIPFAEFLTHDSYLVQLGRITGKMKTRLEKVLSVFEQRYFIDAKIKTTKKYPHESDDNTVNLMLEILEHASGDQKLRSEIELEWASQQILDGLVIEKENKLKEQGKALQKALTKIAEDRKTLAKTRKTLAKTKKTLADKDKTIEKKDQTIAEKDAVIQSLKKQLGI
jgi:hypothetical protein